DSGIRFVKSRIRNGTAHGVDGHGGRQREPLQHPRDPLPRQRTATGSPGQPLPPSADHRVSEAAQAFAIARDSEVAVVTTTLPPTSDVGLRAVGAGSIGTNERSSRALAGTDSEPSAVSPPRSPSATAPSNA